MNMGRNNIYRNDNSSMLTMHNDDDFNCLMADPIFQTHPSSLSNGQSNQNHPQQQQQTNSNSYNAHVLSQMVPISSSAVVATSHSGKTIKK